MLRPGKNRKGSQFSERAQGGYKPRELRVPTKTRPKKATNEKWFYKPSGGRIHAKTVPDDPTPQATDPLKVDSGLRYFGFSFSKSTFVKPAL